MWTYLRQRFYRKVLSFNEYPGFACYHTTWQNVAPTINNCNVQAKGKFQAPIKNKIYKKPVSFQRLLLKM